MQYSEQFKTPKNKAYQRKLKTSEIVMLESPTMKGVLLTYEI